MLYEVITEVRVVLGQKAQFLASVSQPFAGKPATPKRNHRLPLRAPGSRPPGPAGADDPRITSYNVCYTKLLRKSVSGAIKRSRAGLGHPDHPAGCFLFTGPTGVGKTELARTLAQFLFGSTQRMVRFDMSEYTDPMAAVITSYSIHYTKLYDE